MNPTATVAKAIRKELKRLYPNVKFSITSKISAGSDRINIKYDSDIPKSEIKKITNKYLDGYFDGMEETYKYKKNNQEIYRVQYILIQRHIPDSIKLIIKGEQK
jgi:hypothetical protein